MALNEMNSIFQENSQIIRKLGYDESLYDNEFMVNSLFVARVFLLKIRKNYSINMDQLKQAVKIWTRMFPLLRSTIHRQVDPNTQSSKLGLPKFFVPMQKDINTCDNVELLDLSQSELSWMDIIKKELISPFDFVNGPLWRIKLLKLSNDDESNYNYGFVLAKNHALGDGRCTYTISLAYLNILGDVLDNKLEQYENISELESKVTMEDLIAKLKTNHAFKMIIDNKCDTETNRIPKNNLFNQSSTNLGTKLNYFFIKPDDVESLVQKLKLNAAKAKLTGLLSVIICNAYKQACIKNKINDIPLESIQFDNLVSMRPKFGIENSQMGVFSHGLACRIDCDTLNENSDFWSLAERYSTEFHKRIANNEEFSLYETEQTEAMRLINTNFDFVNHTSTNFMLSNIGIMSNTKNQSPISIVEHYPFIPCLFDRVGPFLFFGITTIDKRLCVAISYNEKCFSESFINDLKEEFINKIDILLK